MISKKFTRRRQTFVFYMTVRIFISLKQVLSFLLSVFKEVTFYFLFLTFYSFYTNYGYQCSKFTLLVV